MPTTEQQSHQEPVDEPTIHNGAVIVGSERVDREAIVTDSAVVAALKALRDEQPMFTPGHRPVRVGDRVYWWEMKPGPQAVRPLPEQPYYGDVCFVRPVKDGETENRVDLFVAKEGQWQILHDKARADEPTHGFWCWKD